MNQEPVQSSNVQNAQITSDNIENPQDIPATPQNVQDSKPQQSAESNEITDEEAIAVAQAVMKKPPVVQGEIVEQKNKVGRPSKYNGEMLSKAKMYLAKCRGEVDGKPRMPFIEELAVICDVDDTTILKWTEDNPEFLATISKIKSLQKLRTLQRGFNAKNPTFAIFMLKANHGMMETEKQVLVADRDVKVSITRE